MPDTRRTLLLRLAALAGGAALPLASVQAATRRELTQQAHQALSLLYGKQPKARELAKHAVAVLVFPKIYKGGVIIGGQSGDGVLLVGGKAEAYYNISAASFGLQLGGQTFAYALFFMNRKALDYLRKSDGWSIGSGPSVVVMDDGAAASVTSTTLSQDVYAFPFGQKGLMAGIGIEGSKITHINPG